MCCLNMLGLLSKNGVSKTGGTNLRKHSATIAVIYAETRASILKNIQTYFQIRTDAAVGGGIKALRGRSGQRERHKLDRPPAAPIPNGFCQLTG